MSNEQHSTEPPPQSTTDATLTNHQRPGTPPDVERGASQPTPTPQVSTA